MKKATLYISLLAITLVAPHASIRTSSPREVCKLGDSAGLPTRGWKEIAGVYSCSSPYKEIGTGYPLTNNLAFYATGQSKRVKKVEVVLNVNNKVQSKAALQHLVIAARAIHPSLTGKPISKKIEQALISGTATEEMVDNIRVKVIRDNWPTGSGYGLSLIFE